MVSMIVGLGINCLVRASVTNVSIYIIVMVVVKYVYSVSSKCMASTLMSKVVIHLEADVNYLTNCLRLIYC